MSIFFITVLLGFVDGFVDRDDVTADVTWMVLLALLESSERLILNRRNNYLTSITY